jgi:hypothetical protein
MFDPRRLRGMLAAAAVVAPAMAILSGLALATAEGRPSWLASGDSTIEGGQEAIVGGRIAGALAQERASGAQGPSDLGIVLGSSAVGMAIETDRLEAEAGPKVPSRWLSLFANGANLEDIDHLAELIFGSDLRPKLLVLGIHPGLLARSDDYLTDRLTIDTGVLDAELAARHLLLAKKELAALSVVPLNRAFPNRTRISNRVRGLASLAKRRMFAAMGLGLDTLFRPDPDPWAARLLIPDASSPKMAEAEGRRANVRDLAEAPMREGLHGPVKDKGWNDPDKYDVDGANARALIHLVREARSRDIEVAILLLPEASNLRASIPPEAMRCLRGALENGLAAAAPPVIDLRDALADSLFHDSIHPNKAGREVATRRFAEALRARPSPVEAGP